MKHQLGVGVDKIHIYHAEKSYSYPFFTIFAHHFNVSMAYKFQFYQHILKKCVIRF